MKKIALLLIFTIALTFSFAYATDAAIAPDTITSGNVSSEQEIITDGTQENVDLSGSNVDDDNITNTESGEVTNNSNEHNHDHSTDSATSKTTVWGAVLAIIIVIVIVALVALFSKND